jgi:hypothetical protein
MSNAQTKPTKQLTEVEALAKITKVLDQLSENGRKRVLAFLQGGE